jgi:hypothetical protein
MLKLACLADFGKSLLTGSSLFRYPNCYPWPILGWCRSDNKCKHPLKTAETVVFPC